MPNKPGCIKGRKGQASNANVTHTPLTSSYMFFHRHSTSQPATPRAGKSRGIPKWNVGVMRTTMLHEKPVKNQKAGRVRRMWGRHEAFWLWLQAPWYRCQVLAVNVREIRWQCGEQESEKLCYFAREIIQILKQRYRTFEIGMHGFQPQLNQNTIRTGKERVQI